MEQLYLQQHTRLKGYIPADVAVRSGSHGGAPHGTLLQRVETLEEGMEILLKAQELSWNEEAEQRAAAGCCACCRIC